MKDFMNFEQIPVTNAANLSLLMVNLSQRLLDDYLSDDSAFNVLDLKAQYRGYRYVIEAVRIVHQNLLAIYYQVFSCKRPVSTAKLAKVLLYLYLILEVLDD